MQSQSISLQQITQPTTQLHPQLDQLLSTDPSHISESASKGISLLDLKHQILTSYIHNLVNLLVIRISQIYGLAHDDDDNKPSDSSNQIVEQLVWLRLVFEKIRPLESRLKYQIEKLLKTLDQLSHRSFANPQAQIDHVVNDPLSFRPNPAALEPLEGRKDNGEEHGEEEATQSERADKKSTGIYRPPRVAAVMYPEPSGKTKRMGPAPIALREHVTLATGGPTAETTTGLANAAAKASNRAKALDRMTTYEEANLTRLFSSKKDARRRRNDEAAIALGIQTSAANKHLKRKLGALEGEFDGVLADIHRKSDRYADHLGPAKAPATKSSPALAQGSDLFAKKPKGKKFKKGAFDKAVKKLQK